MAVVEPRRSDRDQLRMGVGMVLAGLVGAIMAGIVGPIVLAIIIGALDGPH
jgi:hypothetical protein